MRHAPSLQEEKRALLARMQASRTDYRRLLTETDEPDRQDERMQEPDMPHPPEAAFPRSRTVQWIMAHPWLCLFGVVAIVAARPDRMLSSVVQRGARMSATAVRFQSQVLVAMKIFGMVKDFLSQRRTRH